MRTFPFGPKAHWPLAPGAASGTSPVGHVFTSAADSAAQNAFSKATPVIAAASAAKLAGTDIDDWSGGFDFHLGVYTND